MYGGGAPPRNSVDDHLEKGGGARGASPPGGPAYQRGAPGVGRWAPVGRLPSFGWAPRPLANPAKDAKFQFMLCRFCVALYELLGGPPPAARTTPAPPSAQPRASRLGAPGVIWEEPAGAREYPTCAEGWAMWAPGRWPDLPEAAGGTAQLGKPLSRPNLLGGPPLGAFRRCVWGALRPSPSCRRRPGEFRRGKRMCSAASPALAGLRRAHGWPHGPRPSN